MKDLARWFERQAQREQRVPRLEDALIGNRFWRYAWYRLRYFFARYFTACLIQGIKFLFLYHLFSRKTFIAIVLGHAVVGFLTSFWWGALEAMRDRVRRLRRSARPDLIPDEVTRWLSLAAGVSTLIVAAAVTWLLWQIWYEHQQFGVSQLYVLSLFLRLALECVARTLHSGVYAVRRVYRPFSAVIGVEFAGFAVVLGLWPWLGRWSFPIGTLVATVLITVLTFHYTLQSYRFLGATPARLFSLGPLTLTPPGSLWEFFGAGLSYAVMKLDSLLVLGLFGISTQTHTQTELFLLFFMISPTIQAGFEWAQLFYFDLKKLEVKPYGNLRTRYEQSIHRLAWLLGCLFWGFGTLTGTVISQRSLGDLNWLLAPFFLSRSLLAFEQIRVFSSRQYRELLKSAVLWLMGFCAIAAGISDDRVKLIVLSIVTLAMFAILRTSAAGPEADATREPLGLSEWLARVREVNNAVRIRALDFPSTEEVIDPGHTKQWPDRFRRRCRSLAGRIARRLHHSGDVTIIPPNRIAWYERGGVQAAAITEEWLVRMGTGLVRALHDTGTCVNGPAALSTALGWRLLGRDLDPDPDDRRTPVDVAEVKESFAALCPDGVVYSPDGTAPTFFDALQPAERRNIIADAARFAREFRGRARGSRFDVTAFSVAGDLRLIFVVDRRFDRQARDRWRTLIKEVNVRAALAPAAE